jgi:hypothetical protein
MSHKSAHNAFPAGRFVTAFAMASTCLLAFPLRGATAPVKQRTFDTPQQAAEAAVSAAEKDDVAAMLEIFGPDGKDLVSSGDAVRDKNDRARFAQKAREKMQVSTDPSNPKRATLSVGADEWPTPIPIVEKGGKWHFDSKQGREEILTRRIGGNELDAIALLRGYVDAQVEYAQEDHDGAGMLQYAQRSISTPGKHDGLFWKNEDGSPGGPIGDLIAKALAEGHKSKTEPYNGYFFRILTAQGPAAPLGARNYIVNGAMIGGFAMLAWPAHYEVTGVQTFIVNYDGIVYQKDLGPETSKIAPTITRYNPDKSWRATQDEE